MGALLVGAIMWRKIVNKLKGKKLAVLGARGVGKTQLIKFLSSGSIPAVTKQTSVTEKAGSRRFQLKELDLKVEETLDVPGDKAFYAEWKDLYAQSDIILYLLRADRLIASDAVVEARVRDDLRHIGGWLDAREGAQRPRLFIIGTHCDLDDEFVTQYADRKGDYMDKFRKLPIVSELVARGGGTRETKIVLGSLKTIQDTEALVYELFRQVVS